MQLNGQTTTLIRSIPPFFFKSLRNSLDDNAITVLDDGNHTFLCAELFTNFHSKHLISPTDFNCMGYCVPAAIGAKLSHPKKQVVGIVGDGAFLMTCMEIITASTENLGIVYFVFHDGELSQISQGQEIPYNRKTCTILGDMKIKGIAMATGAEYMEILNNQDIEEIIPKALEHTKKGQPVIVDVKIDYSKRTRFTKGVVKNVLERFPIGDKVRLIGRAMIRKITG
jgi:acetolactate synthase-1/2/3 large subunit